MIEDEEQPQLLNTIGEYPTEEVGTIEEDIYVIGVESLNGKAGDLTLKSINGEDLVGTGNIALATAAQMQAETQAREQADTAETLARQQADQALQTAVDGKQAQLTDAQLTAVNSGIDSTKVGQIATNATNITTLQNTKQDNLTTAQLAAVNSGIDSTKVGQIATNATNITSLQNTKQDNLTQTQLNAVNSGIDQSKVAQIETNRQNIATNAGDIDTIESKIPGAATSTNQLTDKNYVDNAIATNTADYISDNGQPFQSLADLEAYSGPLTNNDYAFVVSTDSAGNLLYTRYKYNSTAEQWAEEYTIANPTFTSTQWAAIDSGVTATDVAQIGTNESDITGLQNSKQDNLSSTQLDAVNSGIDAMKVTQIATNTGDIATLQSGKQDKLVAGTNIQIAADSKTISATDTTYTAGSGLNLAGTEFSVDTTTIQPKLTAGANVQINGDTISATDTTYDAGSGLDLTGTTFSVDTDMIQPKLTAGTNVQITGDTISATDTTYTAGTGLTLTGTQFSVTEPVPAGFFTDTAAEQTGTGSSITLNNTVNAPIDRAELKGDTFQQTYTGKNLANITQTAQEVNGVTSTRNGGEVALTGTATATSVCQLTNYFTCKAGTTYTMSANNPVANSNVLIRVYRQGGPGRTVQMTTANAYSSFTFTEDESVRIEVRVSSGTAITGSFVFKPQFEIGTSSTSYEPYVGGVPSPNPDYPQDIQVVTGEQTVKVTGKNLFDGILELGYINGTTGANGASNQNIRGKDYIPVKELTNYKFSTNNANITAVYVYEYKADESYNLTANKSIDLSSYLTTNADTAYIRFRPSNQTTDTSIKFQVEEGTVATTYQPYQAQSYEVNLGKNLWGGFANDFTGSPAGISFNNKADGTIEVGAGTSTAEANSINSTQARDNGRIITLPAGRYTLSGSTSSIRVLAVDSTGYGLATSSNGVPASFTLSEKTGVFIRASIPANTTVTATTVRPQLEAGSTATTYAPYFTPIELCKIGNYQDYIWKDGSDWKIHKAIGKVVLTGSEEESWGYNSPSQVFVLSDYVPYLLSGFVPVSNYYTGQQITAYASMLDMHIAFLQGTINRLVIKNSSYSLPADFKNWLSNHNTTAYYVLATPADTTITDATLIAQLEALAGSRTYSPQTNYSVLTPTPNLPAILTVDVFKNNYAGLLARVAKAGV